MVTATAMPTAMATATGTVTVTGMATALIPAVATTPTTMNRNQPGRSVLNGYFKKLRLFLFSF